MSLEDEMENAGRGLGGAPQAQIDFLMRVPRSVDPIIVEPMPLRMPDLSPAMLPIQRPEERAAESFMDGLRQHAEHLESGLRENQELQMFCYHGPESLRVLEVSMPSENVVSLRCLNSVGEEAHVTGHMHAVTFSFLIHTIVPPEVKRPIGFRPPFEGE